MNNLVTCKYEENPIKMKALECSQHFPPLQPYGSYPLPWTPEFRSDLAQNLMQPFPHPNDGPDFRYDWPTGCGDIQVFNVYTQTHKHTDRQTDRRQLD